MFVVNNYLFAYVATRQLIVEAGDSSHSVHLTEAYVADVSEGLSAVCQKKVNVIMSLFYLNLLHISHAVEIYFIGDEFMKEDF